MTISKASPGYETHARRLLGVRSCLSSKLLDVMTLRDMVAVSNGLGKKMAARADVTVNS